MPAPYPNPSFNTTIGLVTHVNAVTNDWATILICIAATLVILIIAVQRNYRISKSLLVSMFFGFFFSSIFWAIGELNGRVPIIFLLLTIAAAIYKTFDDD